MSDCDSTAEVCRAAEIMEGLAKPLFTRAMSLPVGSPAEEAFFEAWFFLCETADYMRRVRRLSIHPNDLGDFRAALELIHDFTHDADMNPCPSWEECKCETAELIRELCGIILAAGLRKNLVGVDCDKAA